MFATLSRLVALPALLLAACASAPPPAITVTDALAAPEPVAEQAPEAVSIPPVVPGERLRVTMKDGRTLYLTVAELREGVLISRNGDRIPLADIESLAVQREDAQGRRHWLALAVPVAAEAIAATLRSLSYVAASFQPGPWRRPEGSGVVAVATMQGGGSSTTQGSVQGATQTASTGLDNASGSTSGSAGSAPAATAGGLGSGAGGLGGGAVGGLGGGLGGGGLGGFSLGGLSGGAWPLAASSLLLLLALLRRRAQGAGRGVASGHRCGTRTNSLVS